MRIYFEDYSYEASLIEPYLGDMNLLEYGTGMTSFKVRRIGYLFVSTEKYSGPVFILPKSFLVDDGSRLNVLGMEGIFPEDVVETDLDEDPDAPVNPLLIVGKETLLPELSLWLYRALRRFLDENSGTGICAEAKLDAQLPEDSARDKDFLSTALALIDFLKNHRNLFTQISLINHSGRNKIDWPKTVSGDPFIQNGEPWYIKLAIREKSVNIDDRLIIIYYSVLNYLRQKYKFPISIGEVPYELLPIHTIQRYLETGIGSKKMKSIRHHYFRDDLKHLWTLLDSFFTHNSIDQDKEKRKEYILVSNFNIVFERMIDTLISDTHGVEELKKQSDGKLVDHIFRYTSLIGNKDDIYYIGDSKYYRDDNRPKGVAFYKQFSYARNAIQYQIDQLYLSGRKSRENIRYRDTLTEGYNITPNFFIRSRVTAEDIQFDTPSLRLPYWDKSKNQEFPENNKHFEDRLFDRDTLILREFSINLLFVIAAYAGYEESYWFSDIHKTIRSEFIKTIDKQYEFFILTPNNIEAIPFYFLHSEWLNGKVYTLEEGGNRFLVAFEKTPKGEKDKQAFRNSSIRSNETGEKITYDMPNTSLKELDKTQ